MYTKGNIMYNHFKEHATIYLFMVILFLTGVIFGAVIVNSMNFVQKQDLYFHLERFFTQIIDGQLVETKDILIQSIFFHLKYLFLLFILGLSVIGLPLVWILIFSKGLVVGFSVGFIVNQMGINGLVLATLSIAPQNIIIIPIYLIAGSLSMIFSLTLLNKLFTRGISHSIFTPFLQYVLVFVILFISSFFGSVIEAFVANEAAKVFLNNVY